MASKPETVKSKCAKSVKWSADSINTFLETYMNYEILWNTRHTDYLNQAKRLSSMLKLQEDLVGLGLAVPDLTFLRARIKTIKTTYRNELIKVNQSTKSGAGTDDVYVPRLLWYSTADSFLRDFTFTRESTSNLDTQTTLTDEDRLDETIADPETEETLLNTADPVIEEDFIEHNDNKTQNAPTFQKPAKMRRLTKLSKIESAIEKLKQITENRPTTSSVQADEVDIFGKYVVSQLKELPLRNRLICQDKIQSMLTKERLALLAPEPLKPSPLVSGSSSYGTGSDNDVEDNKQYTTDGHFLHRNLSGKC